MTGTENHSHSEEVTVSIITISYNQGEFIERTIQSVLGQEGPFSLEYLIVDGGSTDSTLAIIKEYELRLRTGELTPKCRSIDFRHVSEPDRGPTHALNKGLKAARGHVLGIINSDDTLEPLSVKNVLECLAADLQATAAYGDVNFVDRNDRFLGVHRVSPRISMSDFMVDNALDDVFFKKEMLTRIGYFDESLHYANDCEYWVRALSRGIQFVHVPAVLANFRLYSTTRSSGANLAMFIEWLLIQRKYFGWSPYLLDNIGIYSARYALGAELPLSEAFTLMLETFRRQTREDLELTPETCARVMACAHVEKGILEIHLNRKRAFGESLLILARHPKILLTGKGARFVLMLFLPERVFQALRLLRNRRRRKGSYCMFHEYLDKQIIH